MKRRRLGRSLRPTQRGIREGRGREEEVDDEEEVGAMAKWTIDGIADVVRAQNVSS